MLALWLCAPALSASGPAGAWARTGLGPQIAHVPSQLGWTDPTPIQARCIGPILDGRDVVGQASTGSGKTGAYGLPLVELVAEELADGRGEGRLLCLVVVPTRELCVQVASVLKSIAAACAPAVRVGVVYGGTSRAAEAAALGAPPHVLVATPGRLLDHLDSAALAAHALPALVLDEADRLLELGFYDDVVAVLGHAQPAQLLLFSATMPAPVLALVESQMREPYTALLAAEGADQLPPGVRLVGVRCGDTAVADGARDADGTRLRALDALLHELAAARPETGALVFCNTRASAMAAWRHLREQSRARRSGLAVSLLSGEMEQHAREQSLFLLRQRAVHALVATDLGARGLDIDALQTVINFELPPAWDQTTFTHRAGRTGRADASGECYSLCADEAEAAALGGWVEGLGAPPLEWRSAPAREPAEEGARPLEPPAWCALRIGGGKADKLSRGDILGALTGLTGLQGAQVGRIEVYAKASFVGVPRAAAAEVVRLLRAGRIKKERRLVSLVDAHAAVALRADAFGSRRPAQN